MNGYEIFYFSVVAASVLAWLAQRLSVKKNEWLLASKILYFCSFCILLIILGCRLAGVGVDDSSYNSIFDRTRTQGAATVFGKTMIEPGYLILNQVIGLFTDDFQSVIFVMAFLSLGLFYIRMLDEKENTSFLVSFLLFGLMIYPYFFGIMRLSLAVSISFFATRYLEKGNMKKYNLLILLASLFHYSAILMLFMNFVHGKISNAKYLKRFYVLAVLIVPLVFIIAGNVIPTLGGRYAKYIFDSSSAISIRDFDKLPIVLFAALFAKNISKKYKEYPMYLFLYSVAIIVSIYSVFIDFGRAQWYFNIFVCIILSAIVKYISLGSKKYLNLVVIPLVIFYGVLYSQSITNPASNILYLNKYGNIVMEVNK